VKREPTKEELVKIEKILSGSPEKARAIRRLAKKIVCRPPVIYARLRNMRDNTMGIKAVGTEGPLETGIKPTEGATDGATDTVSPTAAAKILNAINFVEVHKLRKSTSELQANVAELRNIIVDLVIENYRYSKRS